jgi:putative heme-binding domain-containing protein
LRGAAIYERLQCHTCHGGAATPNAESRIFGPDLTGVTRRLSRLELADAVVYPSKQVADRYKAIEITLKDGGNFVGFITEDNAGTIAFAERDQVHRFRREQVEKLAPYSASLMPERLLSASTNEEIRDLLAYLENMGGAANKQSK